MCLLKVPLYISNRIVFEHDYFLLIIVECCNIWKTKGAPDNYKLRLGSYHTRRWKHQNCFKGNTQCRIPGFQKYFTINTNNCNCLIYLTSSYYYLQRSADDSMSNNSLKTDTNISFHPRYERAVSRSRSDIVTVVKLLSRGDWHIGVFNDDSNSRTIRAVIGKKRKGSSCPKSCNGHGTCENGKCVCHLQYSGIDCSQSKYCKIMYELHRLYNAVKRP